jgi:RNA polymerase sigma factor (sigma-70 family)
MPDSVFLIEPYIPALRRYAFALTRDHAAADDLVQDCLERAVARWPLRRRSGDVRSWLFAILHNLFISRWRQARRQPHHQMLDDAASAVAGGQDGVLIGRDILRAFNALSADHKAVLLLVGVEGLSYEETGRALGIPIGTVMSRLSRAREALRRHMEGETSATSLRRVK